MDSVDSVGRQTDRKLQPGRHRQHLFPNLFCNIFYHTLGHEKLSQCRLRKQLSGWWLMSTAAFFLVDSRQPFSSHPYWRHKGQKVEHQNNQKSIFMTDNYSHFHNFWMVNIKLIFPFFSLSIENCDELGISPL